MVESQTPQKLPETDSMNPLLTAAGLVLLYIGILSLLLLPPILIFGDTNPSLTTLIVLIVGGGGAIGLAPYLNFVIKHTSHFPGMGNPVPLGQLRSHLREVNAIDVPVVVDERDGTMVVTWRYTDAQWQQLFEQRELDQQYELHLKFRPDTHEVLLVDITRSRERSTGLFGFFDQYSFSRGVMGAYDHQTVYGLRENFTIGKVAEYEFKPSEIKIPVMNTILSHGWDVRYSMW